MLGPSSPLNKVPHCEGQLQAARAPVARAATPFLVVLLLIFIGPRAWGGGTCLPRFAHDVKRYQ
jgi:hypothetical protein